MSKKKHVIWAVNPFEADAQVYKRCAEVLRSLTSAATPAGQSPYQIEPVYILYPDEEYLSSTATSFPWVRELKARSKKLLEDALKGIDLDSELLLEPKILVNSLGSLRTDVRALTAYAQSVGSEFILVASHANTGLKRLILGSFAESLLLQSEVPVVIVNPTTHSRAHVKKVLFATDLSETSFEAFERVVAFARQHGARLEIVHQIPNHLEPLLAASVNALSGPYLPMSEYFSKDEPRARAEAEKWRTHAKSLGVDVSVKIAPQGSNTVETILREADECQADLIALASQSGAIKAAILGSVTKEVIRSAKVPVWTLHVEKHGSAGATETLGTRTVTLY